MSTNLRRKAVSVLIVIAGLSLMAFGYAMDNTVDGLLGIAAALFGLVTLWSESAPGDR